MKIKVKPKPAKAQALSLSAALQHAVDNGLESLRFHFERGRGDQWVAVLGKQSGWGPMVVESGMELEPLITKVLAECKRVSETPDRTAKRQRKVFGRKRTQ